MIGCPFLLRFPFLPLHRAQVLACGDGLHVLKLCYLLLLLLVQLCLCRRYLRFKSMQVLLFLFLLFFPHRRAIADYLAGLRTSLSISLLRSLRCLHIHEVLVLKAVIREELLLRRPIFEVSEVFNHANELQAVSNASPQASLHKE